MNSTKTRIHFAPTYLHNPLHPLTVTLVGAGGNGSQMLSSLARMNAALRALEHPGLEVTVYDPDTVEAPNIGRQLFSPSEIGQNKAKALVTRFNRFYGTSWKAEAALFDGKNYNQRCGNILVTCTDNARSRIDIGKGIGNQYRYKGKGTPHLYEGSWMYWLDLGNAQNTGQVILGSNVIKQPKMRKFETVTTLPLVTEEFELNAKMDRKSGPSCSMAEALAKQDLFVNSAVATAASSLLWQLLRNNYTTKRGVYVNLTDLSWSPIPV